MIDRTKIIHYDDIVVGFPELPNMILLVDNCNIQTANANNNVKWNIVGYILVKTAYAATICA